MERFAIKIDENVRLRLYKICRLCGTDNRNNSEILEGEQIISDGEPDFHKKILDCIGIQVTKLDKMPQTVCDLCRDKINDFFEFREMCVTNDMQTRRLLGLPPVCIPKDDPSVDVKVLVDDKDAVAKTIKKRKYTHKKVKEERKQLPDIKKKLKTENAATKPVNGRKRKAPAMNLLAEKPPNKRERLRENQINRKSKLPLPLTMRPELAVDGAVSNVFCAICDKPFYNAGELHRHLDFDHVPRIVAYHCVRCDETISEKLAIRNHNLWHKLSKTPFECGLCAKIFPTLGGYTRHTQSCLTVDRPIEFETKTCTMCREDFVTQNLYNWHSCMLAKLTCPICQCTFKRKLATLKHILRCSPSVLNTTLSTELEMPDDEPFNNSISDDSMSIHDEINIKPDIDLEIDVPRKKPEAEPSHFVVIPPGITNSTNVADTNIITRIPAEVSARNFESVKSSISNIAGKALPAVINVKKEPGVNISEIESNINVLSSNQVSNSVVVDNPELASMSLRIKAEIINPEYQGLYDPEISANIKQERLDEAQTLGSPKPTLKLVIKKEHGTLNSSFVNNSGSSSDPDVSLQRKKKKKSKKIFKIPKELAMKIKQEKLDGYEAPMNSNANDLDNDANYDVTVPVISQICSVSDLDLPSEKASDGLSLDCITDAGSENDAPISKSNTPEVRVPIISCVSSGNVIKSPRNVQNEHEVVFPAIRIKSEFGLFNFADDNSSPNVVQSCDQSEYVGNVRIKTEKIFDTDEYQVPVLYSNRENVELNETERQRSDIGMDILNPVVVVNTNTNLNSSLNLAEPGKSIRNEDKDNDAADLIISRVESIKTEFEPSVTLLNPFANASASRYAQIRQQNNQNETVACTQNSNMNEITRYNCGSQSSNQVMSIAPSRDEEDNVPEDHIDSTPLAEHNIGSCDIVKPSGNQPLPMSVDQNILDPVTEDHIDTTPLAENNIGNYDTSGSQPSPMSVDQNISDPVTEDHIDTIPVAEHNIKNYDTIKANGSQLSPMSVDQKISDPSESQPVNTIPNKVSLDDEECVIVPNSDEKVDNILDLVSEDDSLSLHDSELEEEIEKSTKRNEVNPVDNTDLVLESDSDSLHNFDLEAEIKESVNKLHENETQQLRDVYLPNEISSSQNFDREIHKDINPEILNPSEVSNINKLPNDNEDTIQPVLEKNEINKTLNAEHGSANFLELTCDKYEHLDKESETDIISEKIRKLPPTEATREENTCLKDESNSFKLENNDKRLDDNFELLINRATASTSCIISNTKSTNEPIPNSDSPIPVVANHQQSLPMTEIFSSVASSEETAQQSIVKSNLESRETCTSHNINEIAENHNNANIEKQLQNEFDDISSNSNLDLDESTVGSLIEISESSISISAEGKLTPNQN